jgi:hypothetical protein
MTIEFDDILEQISIEITRIKNEYCIYSVTHETNQYNYNQLVTILVTLQQIHSN